jgi:amino acid permease
VHTDLVTLQDVAIIIFTYGSTIAYIIVIGDTLPALSVIVGLDPDVFYTQRWFLMTIATIILVLPLALLKHLSSLRFTAILGFGATLYLIGAMFYRVVEKFVVEDGFDTDEIEVAKFDVNFFVAAPIVFYAFSSHVNIFSITKELRNPTPQRVDTVIVGNVALATLVYGVIGICGYLTFLDDTKDNVINNYDTVLHSLSLSLS